MSEMTFIMCYDSIIFMYLSSRHAHGGNFDYFLRDLGKDIEYRCCDCIVRAKAVAVAICQPFVMKSSLIC